MFFMIKCRVYIFGKNASEEMFSEHPVRRVMALIGHSSDGNVEHLRGSGGYQPGFSAVEFFFFFFFCNQQVSCGENTWRVYTILFLP